MMNSGLVLTSKAFKNLTETVEKDPINASILPILASVWSVVWNREGHTTIYDIISSIVEVIDPMPAYDKDTVEFVGCLVNSALPGDARISPTEFLQVVHAGGLDVYYTHEVEIPRTINNIMYDCMDLKILTDSLQIRVTSLLAVNLKLHYQGKN
jgi:hypothetical protein